MKNTEKTFNLFYELIQKEKSLNDDYDHLFRQVLNSVSRHQKDIVKANVLLSVILDEFLEHQKNNGDASKMITKSVSDYIKKIDKGIDYKIEIIKVKKFDFEKFTISGLWLTMCSYLSLLFIKEFLTERYLINFSIDLIVAAVSLVVCFIAFKNHYQLMNRYKISRKSMMIEVMGIVVGLFITVMTLKSPFDISFLILVVAHFFAKKRFKYELDI